VLVLHLSAPFRTVRRRDWDPCAPSPSSPRMPGPPVPVRAVPWGWRWRRRLGLWRPSGERASRGPAPVP